MASADRLIARRFRLRELLGRGAMGEVWQSTDERTGKTVAVKLLRGELAKDLHMRERFAREARSIAAVVSPYVCSLLEAGFDGPTSADPYAVFELVVGEPLDRRLKRLKIVAPVELTPILDAVLLGLDAAHRVGVVHRDLKPSNVVVTTMSDGRISARLLDFGVAKMLLSNDPTLTSDGAYVGTLAYMPPERLTGSAPVSPAGDLYAAATIVFRALTGRLPFATRDAVALIATKTEFDAPTLEESTAVAWPPSLERFMRRSLCREPDKRFASAAAMAHGWQQAVAMAGSLSPTAAGDDATTGDERIVESTVDGDAAATIDDSTPGRRRDP